MNKPLIKFISFSLNFLTAAAITIFISCSSDGSSESSSAVNPPEPGGAGELTVSGITRNSAEVSWEAASDPADSPEELLYSVVYSTADNLNTADEAGENGTVSTDWTAGITSAAVPGLSSGTLYYINVLVKNTFGAAAAYTAASAATLEDNPPEITDKTISVSGLSYTTLTLTWNRASDDFVPQEELLYLPLVSQNNNIGTAEDALSNGTELAGWSADLNTVFVSGLTHNTQYFFNVLVKDDAGNISAYESVSAATIEDLDPLPGGASAVTLIVISSTEISLSWTAASDDVTAPEALLYSVIKSYSDDISTADDAINNGITEMDWTADISAADIEDLLQSTAYYFNILVKDQAGNISAYSTVSGTTDASSDTPPVAGGASGITDVVLSDETIEGMNIQWHSASDTETSVAELKYSVFASTVEAHLADFITAEINAVEIIGWEQNIIETTAAGLEADTLYYVNVFILDGTGNTAAYTVSSTSTLAFSPPVPGEDGLLTVSEKEYENLILSWFAASDNATPQENIQYSVYISSSDNIGTVEDILTNGNGTQIAGWTANLLSLYIDGLQDDTQYFFNVLTRDHEGYISAYASRSATTYKFGDMLPDDYEGDNNKTNAFPVTELLTVQNHNLHLADDVDYFSAVLTAGQTLTIETSFYSITTDTVLNLYGAAAPPIMTDDNGAGGTYSKIVYDCTTDGTYYFSVQENGNDSTGDYTINISIE